MVVDSITKPLKATKKRTQQTLSSLPDSHLFLLLYLSVLRVFLSKKEIIRRIGKLMRIRRKFINMKIIIIIMYLLGKKLEKIIGRRRAIMIVLSTVITKTKLIIVIAGFA